MTRLAAFSDVHGNLSALEAVRAAVAKSSPDVVIVTTSTSPGRRSATQPA